MELEPGQKIRDVELADSFEVSRTPIREALKQLELEGLVETRPASHTRISEIDRAGGERVIRRCSQFTCARH